MSEDRDCYDFAQCFAKAHFAMESNAIVSMSRNPQPIIQEVDDETALTVQPSEDEVLASFDFHLHEMVNHFWQQTQQRANEHALLNQQQHQQARQQDEALQAVYTDAQNSVHELAAHHRQTTGQIELALTECRQSMEQRLMSAVAEQNQLTQQLHASIRDQLQVVLAEAQQEIIATRQQVIQHEQNTANVEQRMRAALAAVESDFSVRLENLADQSASNHAERDVAMLVDDQSNAEHQTNASNSGKMTTRRVKALIERSVTAMETRVESKMQELLQRAMHEQIAGSDHTPAAEERLASRLQAMMKDAQGPLESDIKVQQSMIKTIGSTVASVGHTVQQLEARIVALEEATVPTRAEVEQRVSMAIKRVVSDALGHQAKGRRRRPKHRLDAHRFDAIIKNTQKDVKQRAEIAARYYEMRMVAYPREKRMSLSDFSRCI